VQSFSLMLKGLLQGCTSPGCLCRLGDQAPAIFAVAPNILGVVIADFSFHTKIRISSHVPSRNHQIIVRFTGRYIVVCPQCDTSFIVTLLALRIWRRMLGFWKTW